MNKIREALLQKILTQPTAPFREGHVISTIIETLTHARVPHFLDPIGNLVLGANSLKDYLQLIQARTSEPVRFFIAHMDHPGFHGTHWKSETELEIKWYGGSPTQHLDGAAVWLADKIGWKNPGKMQNVKLHPSGRAIETASILFTQAENYHSTPDAKSLFGGFSFRAPWWQNDELIYTKAADDLVGSFAIISLFLDYWEQNPSKSDYPFLGLLTRAEEVGFIGAIGHFELGWLNQSRRPLLCVSLETSRTLPGAEIGKGPVIRLGDKFTVFDPGALRVFSDLGNAILPNQHQRRVMDGGTCEASAATVFGFPSIGISVPLGNYHNQSLEGGPDSSPPQGPAPEFVHSKDIAGLIELCHALLQFDLPWTNPWQKKLKEFRSEFKSYQQFLMSEI